MAFLLSSGNKPELIRIIKQKDKAFLMKFLREVAPMQQYLVKTKMDRSVLVSADDAESIVCTINKDLEVTKGTFRQLGLNMSLGKSVMDTVSFLFQMRDDRIHTSYESVNSNRHGYQPWKRSKFLPVSFWDLVIVGTDAIDLIARFFSEPEWKTTSYRFIYFHVYSYNPAAVDRWAIARIDFDLHTVEYFDGRVDGRPNLKPPELTNFLDALKTVLRPILVSLCPEYMEEWVCSAYTETYFELLDNNYDSGVYTTAITYFLCQTMPLYFDRISIQRLRMSLAYWILVGELPI